MLSLKNLRIYKFLFIYQANNEFFNKLDGYIYLTILRKGEKLDWDMLS